MIVKMTLKDFRHYLDEAVARVKHMDAVDSANGTSPPLMEYPRIMFAAFHAGLAQAKRTSNGWEIPEASIGCLFDAIVYSQFIETVLTTLAGAPDRPSCS